MSATARQLFNVAIAVKVCDGPKDPFVGLALLKWRFTKDHGLIGSVAHALDCPNGGVLHLELRLDAAMRCLGVVVCEVRSVFCQSVGKFCSLSRPPNSRRACRPPPCTEKRVVYKFNIGHDFFVFTVSYEGVLAKFCLLSSDHSFLELFQLHLRFTELASNSMHVESKDVEPYFQFKDIFHVDSHFNSKDS
ncbi:hypothetical protein L596_010045 [Steinernema carpocapsae]|uniref:Uncharacterized protein n=1 Tax=Steinernema carpocapsae TaxID=34508 RepID=A0A4U5PH59_STECR|nr:hypothetical protein L596_010045 [Steinernema carpocapsae]